MADNLTLKQLMQLQTIDQEIDRLEEDKEKAEKDLAAAHTELSKARAALEQGKKSTETVLKARGAMELESKTKVAAISKHKEEIYLVKSNEAYAALQTEIARLTLDNASLEEQILVRMEEEDAARKAVIQAQAQIKIAEQKVNEEQSKYQRQIAEIDGRIQTKTAEQEQLAGQITDGSVERYRRIRDNRGGMAIAAVKDGTCGGCRMTVRPQMLIEVQRSPGLVLCESCGRILSME